MAAVGTGFGLILTSSLAVVTLRSSEFARSKTPRCRRHGWLDVVSSLGIRERAVSKTTLALLPVLSVGPTCASWTSLARSNAVSFLRVLLVACL